MGSSTVLGLDFGGTKTAVAVADADGTILGRAVVPAARDARANLAAAVECARALLTQVLGHRGPDAVGVSTFGIPGTDGVALAPAIEGWSGLAIAREVGQAFGGVPVKVATDVKVAARLEAQRGALAGCDPAVYLNLGTGLAVAIVAGGTVIAGRNGASGEIGYNLRRVADVGVPLYGRTMLEETVSGGALLAAAGVAAPEMDGDAAAVFAAAADHPGLGRVLGEFLDELAFHLVNLTIAVDPHRIAVGGGMVRSWDILAPRLRAALDAAVPYPPELVQAAFPYDAPLLGALALGADAVAPLEKTDSLPR
jgi:glucokinase